MKIKELLDKNLIEPGDVLVWDRKQIGKKFTAEIDSSGKIHIDNGSVFDSPSGAARHFSNGVAVDGWRVWKVERLNKTLGEIRVLLKSS